MKRYKITFDQAETGEAPREVDATSYGPRYGNLGDKDAAFTTFVIEERREVLTVRTDAILSIEEVTG